MHINERIAAEEKQERAVLIANARLGVAEDLGAIISALIGIIIFLKWDSYILAAAGVFLVWLILRLHFQREWSRQTGMQYPW